MRSFKLISAIELSISAMLSLWIGTWLSQRFMGGSAIVGGLWALISAVLIESTDFPTLWHNAKARAFGTLTGSVIALIVFSVLGYSYFSCGLALMLVVVSCAVCRVELHRLACITIGIIFVVSQMEGHVPPWINSFERLLQSLVGIVVALLVGLPTIHCRRRYRFFE